MISGDTEQALRTFCNIVNFVKTCSYIDVPDFNQFRPGPCRYYSIPFVTGLRNAPNPLKNKAFRHIKKPIFLQKI